MKILRRIKAFGRGTSRVDACQGNHNGMLITTGNHESPRYITSEAARGTRIRPAPVLRHTNVELRLLENIVGRDVPPALRKAYSKY